MINMLKIEWRDRKLKKRTGTYGKESNGNSGTHDKWN